jgi:hypothetical protein
MADFRLPGAGYSSSFKRLKVSGGALIALWGGAGTPDPVGDLYVDVVQNATCVAVKELKPDPASPQNIGLFRIVGLQRGSAQLTARVNKDSASTLYCDLALEVAQAQEDFAIKFASKIDLTAFRLTGIAPSVMLGQACIESSFGGRDSKTRTINPKSRVVVSNTIFGITKPPGKFAWFTKCKTIVSTTEAVAGKGIVQDYFCVAGDYQEALDVYTQYVKENPSAPRINAMTSKPRYAWNDGDLLTLANLMHSELNFGMGVPSYGSDVMSVIRTNALKIYDPPEKNG